MLVLELSRLWPGSCTAVWWRCLPHGPPTEDFRSSCTLYIKTHRRSVQGVLLDDLFAGARGAWVEDFQGDFPPTGALRGHLQHPSSGVAPRGLARSYSLGAGQLLLDGRYLHVSRGHPVLGHSCNLYNKKLAYYLAHPDEYTCRARYFSDQDSRTASFVGSTDVGQDLVVLTRPPTAHTSRWHVESATTPACRPAPQRPEGGSFQESWGALQRLHFTSAQQRVW